MDSLLRFVCCGVDRPIVQNGLMGSQIGRKNYMRSLPRWNCSGSLSRATIYLSSRFYLIVFLVGLLPGLTWAQTNVVTQHYDTSRTGLNPNEVTLTPANVNSTQFGKLFSHSVDGMVYAQPLYVQNVTIPGKGTHNVVFVETQNDSVYAFDADSNAGTNANPLWKVSVIDTAHGAASGATSVSSMAVNCNNVTPLYGIDGTPTIDVSSGTMYVEAESMENGSVVHRLHALDITTGAEKSPGPILVNPTVSGTGKGSVNGQITLDPTTTWNRTGLLLMNGTLYISFGAHCDNSPWHGWLMAYNASTFALKGVYISSPNGTGGGIWMAAGAGIAADSSGNIYITTGNGSYDGVTEFSDSVVKLGPVKNGTFPIADWFTPFDQSTLEAQDLDQGSGGVLLVPDQPAGSPRQHLLVTGGKDGTIYLLDRDNLGQFNPNNNGQVWQSLTKAVPAIFSTSAWWNNNVYVGGAGTTSGTSDFLRAFQFDPSTSMLSGVATSHSPELFGYPAPTPVVSANGTTNAIVWVLKNNAYASGGPAILYAYDATDLANELYNSSQNSVRDNPGPAVKFTIPTLTNGKAYVGTQTQLSVFGEISLLSAVSLNPASVTGGTPSTGTVILGAAAPSGGVVVSLSSSNTAVATVPGSVTVNSGATTANFTVTTHGVATISTPLISATYNGSRQSAILTVNPGQDSPAITTTSLPNGTQNAAYSTTLAATGGTTPYSWSVSVGTLPAGLTLAASTGVISGTPSATGTTSFTVQVTDANSVTATKSLSLTVVPPPSVTTTSLPNGTQNAAYTTTLAATGGTTPYSWSVSVGTLPAGLTLAASTGVISGTPSATGTTSFTVQVTDANSATATQPLSLTVVSPPSVTTTSLSNGTQNAAYTTTLAATGGTTPYSWSVSVGTLPAGLTLAASTGVISGTPSATGTTNFTVQVTDANSQKATQALSLTVVSAPTVTTASLPNGTQNAAYSTTLAATGGTTPYSWSVSVGTLPAGLTLAASTGVISGTPSATGTTSFTVQVTDANSATATQPLSLTVVPPPSVTTTSLSNGTQNAAYTTTLAATGGTTPYSWSVSVGTLPAGLTLAASTGVISGKPTGTGTTNFTVQVTDVNSQTATQPLSITIAPPPLAVTTASLPNGIQNAAYTTTLAATGGTTPYTWSVSVGALPAGLTLASSTGVISGTPTVLGTTNFTVQVTDANSLTASQPLSLTVVAPPPTITTASLPNGTQNTAYSTTLAATGGTAPYTWSVSVGALPAGLTLASSTGVISGTPTVTGSSNFTVQVTDANLLTATKNLSITVNALSSITFVQVANNLSTASGQTSISVNLATTAGHLLVAFVREGTNATDNFTISDSGGNTWAQTTSGYVSAGSSHRAAMFYSFTTQADTSVTANFTTGGGVSPTTITVMEFSGPTATDGSANSFKYPASSLTSGTLTTTQSTDVLIYAVGSGGNQTLWTAGSGFAIPNNNVATGANGSNARSGMQYQIVAAPFNGTTSMSVGTGGGSMVGVFAGFSIPLPGGPSITTTSLPGATQNASYSTTLAASGGTTPYSWSISSGTLPTGLSLASSTGVISGTPTAAGTTNFTVQVTDANSVTATKSLSLTVAPPPSVSTTSLPNGTQNVAYSTTLAATGGTTPYTWSITSGALPAGLSLASGTGVISGTPTGTGTSNFTVQVTDANSQTAAQPLSLTVGTTPPTITTISLPNGTQNVSYSTTLAASGGTTPYTWSISSGTLPTGLSLASSTGVISGTPTATGTSSFTVQVTDAISQTATKNLSITVNALSSITFVQVANNLSTASGQTSISVNLATTAGHLLVAFVREGTNATDNFTVSDSGGNTWTQTSSGYVNANSSHRAGMFYSFTANADTTVTANFTTGGGVASTSITVMEFAGPIAADGSVNSIGTAMTSLNSGTLTTVQSTDVLIYAIGAGANQSSWTAGSNFTIPNDNVNTGASGSNARTAMQYQIVAAPFSGATSMSDSTSASMVGVFAGFSVSGSGGPSITTTSLPGATQNASYGTTLAASGGTAPYTWSISSGTLPTGLSLASSTGVISGTPTTTGTGNFTVQVTDANLRTATKNLSITVNAPSSITFVQVANNLSTASGQTSISVNLATTAGHLLVAFVREGKNAADNFTISDSGGNTWAQTTSGYVSAGSSHRAAMFYSFTTQADTSVTANFTTGGGVSPTTITVMEFSGLTAADGSVNSSNISASSLTSGTLTTTQSPDVLIYAVGSGVNRTSWTAGSGFAIPNDNVATGANGSNARFWNAISDRCCAVQRDDLHEW